MAQIERLSFAHFKTIRFFVCTSLIKKLLTNQFLEKLLSTTKNTFSA